MLNSQTIRPIQSETQRCAHRSLPNVTWKWPSLTRPCRTEANILCAASLYFVATEICTFLRQLAVRAYSSCHSVLSRSFLIHWRSERCSPRPHPHAHQRIIASKALRQEQSNQTNQEPKTEKTGRSGEIEKTKSDVETNTNTNANYDRETQQRTNKGPCDRRAEWYLTRIGARRNQRVRRCVQCWGSLRKLSV